MPRQSKNAVAPQPAPSGGQTAEPSGAPTASNAAASASPEATLLALLANEPAQPEGDGNNAPAPAVPETAPATEETPGAPVPPENPEPPADAPAETPEESPEAEPASSPESPTKTAQAETAQTAESPKAEKRIRDLAQRLEQSQRMLETTLNELQHARTNGNERPAPRTTPTNGNDLSNVFDGRDLQRMEGEARIAMESAERLISLVPVDPAAAESELRRMDLLKSPEGQTTQKEMLDMLWSGKRMAQARLNAVPKRAQFLIERAKNLQAAHAEFPWLNNQADERRALAKAEYDSDPRWADDVNADAKIAKIVEHDWAKRQKAKANGKPAVTTATATARPAVPPKPVSTGPRTTGGSAPPPLASAQADAKFSLALQKAKQGSAAGLVEALALTDWGR